MPGSSCIVLFERDFVVCQLAQELLEVGVGDDVPCEVHACLRELQGFLGGDGVDRIVGVGGVGCHWLPLSVDSP
ncbi:hypothetical protein RMDY18_01190 [Rothia mucilaginosa DY-18]|uniref:Uncharacterized protein n=1 Tax=Rothia mucilaginosa (strain DY-18) TaxID=680646 RepID=D2NQM5_ROTMD|nr:hypothetical protein RMDY18_01190 [Rothia mucilaginosa DY-18]